MKYESSTITTGLEPPRYRCDAWRANPRLTADADGFRDIDGSYITSRILSSNTGYGHDSRPLPRMDDGGRLVDERGQHFGVPVDAIGYVEFEHRLDPVLEDELEAVDNLARARRIDPELVSAAEQIKARQGVLRNPPAGMSTRSIKAANQRARQHSVAEVTPTELARELGIPRSQARTRLLRLHQGLTEPLQKKRSARR